MYYLCIGQRRKPRAAAGFLLFFGPFRGSQRASSRPTAGYVGKTKCLVVLRKCLVIFSKCFPLKTTKPRDCFRRLKTLKFSPTYLWKTAPRKATAGGSAHRTARPPSRQARKSTANAGASAPTGCRKMKTRLCKTHRRRQKTPSPPPHARKNAAKK